MKYFLIFVSLIFWLGNAKSQDLSTSDSLILNQIFQKASENNWSQKSLPEIELKVTNYFKGSPYVANTLDQDSTEKLVINLQGFDCVTFVETVMALSLSIKAGRLSNEVFAGYLEQVRYRKGKREDYASRLHYFSEWLTDNQHKGILEIVSNQIGTTDLDIKVDIISRNWHKHRFHADTVLIHQIKETETRISSFKLKYIPKDQLENTESNIQNGDIIAITTSINGLDVVHTGMAIHVNDQLHLCHASSELGKVVISEVPLSNYLQSKKRFTGVLVARLIP